MNFEARRQRLREAMVREGIDLLAVWPGAHMRYLLGFSPLQDERPCYLLLTPDDEAMLMPALNASQAQAHVSVPMEVYEDAEGPARALAALDRRLRISAAKNLVVDETMRSDFVALLLERVASPRFGVATDILGAMRMRKEPEEIERLRENARQADAAWKAGLAAVREGVTEAQLAEVVTAAFTREGAESINFAIVGAGENSAFPHHHTSRRAVRRGEPVLFDIGAHYEDYNSDLTRMAYLGEPSPEYLKVHAVVEAAVRAAIAAARPGAAARDVDRAARDVIADAGYGEYFTHRVGHGIGLTGHEPPYMTATNDLPLEVGMTFSIEPGIYLPGQFGVRLEEIVVVTPEGAEVLSGVSRELSVIQ